MGKKINCKHGLDRKQEIQARRIKEKIIKFDEDIFNEYYLYRNEWLKSHSNVSFKEFLKQKNIVHYSAYVRACSVHGEARLFTLIGDLRG